MSEKIDRVKLVSKRCCDLKKTSGSKLLRAKLEEWLYNNYPHENIKLLRNFDGAFLGIIYDDAVDVNKAVYSISTCIRLCMENMSMDWNDASEFFFKECFDAADFFFMEDDGVQTTLRG